jgi:TIR domain
VCRWQFVSRFDKQALPGPVEVGAAGEQAGVGDAQAEQGCDPGRIPRNLRHRPASWVTVIPRPLVKVYYPVRRHPRQRPVTTNHQGYTASSDTCRRGQALLSWRIVTNPRQAPPDEVKLPPPSIFISHSAKERSAKALLDGLYEAMRTAGLDAFVAEHDIDRGVNYKRKLFRKLFTCRGAIVLLSPRALASPWVHSEVSVLIGRHWQEEGRFMLLPVLVAGATPEHVKKSPLGDLNLPDLNAPPAAEKEVVLEIVELFKQICGPPGPLHDLEVTVANLLRDADDGALELVAEVLGLDLTRWQPYGKRHAVAKEMLCANTASFARAMNRIGEVVEKPIAIIDLVFPFTWIDERSAAPLREAARGVPPRPSLAVNSARHLTGRWYVRRACPEPRSWYVMETVGPEDESYDQALEQQIRLAALEKLGYYPDEDVSADELAAALAGHEQTYGPIFVLLPPLADKDTIAKLREAFPGLVFLVLLGDVKDGQPVPGGVRILTPLLDAGAEGESHREYRILTREFKQPAPASVMGGWSADG